jgi:thiamine-monophosphate kinase
MPAQKVERRASARRVAPRPPATRTRKPLPLTPGIGDDCAVLRIPPRSQALLTTDFCLEGVHFRREWHPAEAVGHRCLARGLSDIAAMGGTPLAAFLSLALPATLGQRWVDGFIRGLLRLARAHGVVLAGGDTAQSSAGFLADIVVLGAVPAGRAILRSGARPGDAIYVTGELGVSAAVLRRLMAHPRSRLSPRRYPRHFFPEPRVAVGAFLRAPRLATAMIDVSDGLSTDLRHLCDESGVGARLHAGAIPRPAGPGRLDLALNGGEDYELLFTAPARAAVPPRIAGVRVTRIGEITRRRSLVLVEAGKERPLAPGGWQHFAKTSAAARARKT